MDDDLKYIYVFEISSWYLDWEKILQAKIENQKNLSNGIYVAIFNLKGLNVLKFTRLYTLKICSFFCNSVISHDSFEFVGFFKTC